MRGDQLVERIAQHRHCQNCDKAILYKDKFCDENCETEHKTKLKAKKKQLVYFYAMMVAVFILAMALVFLG
jgi:predicted nucleic acid-binding Zn ribbon protein